MLTVNGFREDAAEDDPMRVMVRRDGPAGFPQLFDPDPDRNIIEINGALVVMPRGSRFRTRAATAMTSPQPIISPSSSPHRESDSKPTPAMKTKQILLAALCGLPLAAPSFAQQVPIALKPVDVTARCRGRDHASRIRQDHRPHRLCLGPD